VFRLLCPLSSEEKFLLKTNKNKTTTAQATIPSLEAPADPPPPTKARPSEVGLRGSGCPSAGWHLLLKGQGLLSHLPQSHYRDGPDAAGGPPMTLPFNFQPDKLPQWFEMFSLGSEM